MVCCNDYAAALGVKAGQKHATATALVDGHRSQFLTRDQRAEAATLSRLQQWAYAITPTITLWKDNSLQLEIGCCLLLHGGLEALLERVHSDLDRRGFQCGFGIAPSREAAWLLAQNQHWLDAIPLPGVSIEARLESLPLLSIDEFERDITALAKAGIHTIGNVLAMPSSALRRRCSQAFCNWLDRLAAKTPEALADFKPAPEFSDTLWLGYGTNNQSELIPLMRDLLSHFCQFLRNTQLETSHIEWTLFPAQGQHLTLDIHSSDCHSEALRWLEQSDLQLSNLPITDLIEGIQLKACELRAGHHATQDLFLEAKHQEPLTQLIDRLRSRLGFQAVNRVYSRTEHLPEHCSYENPNEFESVTSSTKILKRPFWLLDTPQPISQRNNQLFWVDALEIIQGPERLEDYWWSHPTSRDYYIASSKNGQPVWIFQDRHTRCWFLHGIFS